MKAKHTNHSIDQGKLFYRYVAGLRRREFTLWSTLASWRDALHLMPKESILNIKRSFHFRHERWSIEKHQCSTTTMKHDENDFGCDRFFVYLDICVRYWQSALHLSIIWQLRIGRTMGISRQMVVIHVLGNALAYFQSTISLFHEQCRILWRNYWAMFHRSRNGGCDH